MVGAPGAVGAGILRVGECTDKGGLQCGCSMTCEEAKSDPSLSPSGGPTQTGATHRLMFCAVIREAEGAEFAVVF